MSKPNKPAAFNLKQQARTLAAVVGDTERNRFIVGSSTLRRHNELRILELHDDTSDMTCEMVCEHGPEIWNISPCPGNPNMLWTTHNSGQEFGHTLWQLPEDTGGVRPDHAHPLALTSLAEIHVTSKRAISMLWSPSRDGGTVVSVEDRSLGVFSIDASTSAVKETSRVWVDGGECVQAGSWDPHHQSVVFVASGNSLRAYDTRTSREGAKILGAHRHRILDVDINPNRPNTLVTGGDDYMMRVWDTRKPMVPCKTLAAHSHWVKSVRYNRYHDQLVLSGGADQMVCLWNISSLSAAPVDEPLHESKSKESAARDVKKAEDALVLSEIKHQDTVCAVAWSACDGWVYASLSYDGYLMIASVPSTEKYKILL